MGNTNKCRECGCKRFTQSEVTASGAVGGALVGAAAGSIFGPVGTVIGGTYGLLGGGVSGGTVAKVVSDKCNCGHDIAVH
jgi:hypothetical protein